jgi:hypothetical protein
LQKCRKGAALAGQGAVVVLVDRDGDALSHSSRARFITAETLRVTGGFDAGV